jgi:6-hydroxycyclohex-1-ene-1-carbonyl-CoA dehydrogenase
MRIEGHRWQMSAVNAPLSREPAAFEAGDGEVVVKIAGCGVCHTDLGYLYDGVRTNQPLPLALGHEISGTVVATGRGAEAWLAKAVIVPAVLPCGECDHCRRGVPTICRHQKMPGNDIHGGFATHIVVPARGLCEVDVERLAKAGLTLAEVSIVADAVTTPYQAVHRAGVAAGTLAIVVDEAKLAAIARHGASLALDARQHDQRGLKAAIVELARARKLPTTQWFIFECSGTAPGQLTAFGLLVHGATLSVVGFTMDKVEVRLSNLMAFDARALGNWGCPPEHYPAALDLVLSGKVAVKPFVEERRLDDINDVFHAVHHREIRKRAVLVPG